MLRIKIIYFTYKNDAQILKESLKSVKHTFDKYKNDIVYSVSVLDEINKELDTDTIKFIQSLNFNYRVTDWDRKGNLIGQQNLVRQVEEFYNESIGYDYIIKIDSDTMIYDLNFLLTKINDTYLLYGNSFNNTTYPIGNFYMIKVIKDNLNILQLLLSDIRHYPSNDICHEDVEIGQRITKIGREYFDYKDQSEIFKLSLYNSHDILNINPLKLKLNKISNIQNINLICLGCQFYKYTRDSDKKLYKQLQLYIAKTINQTLL